LEEIIARASLPSLSKSAKFSGLVSEGVLSTVSVGILFPTTFMNNSGTAVAKYLAERGAREQLVVVHDDVDLPIGEVRISYDRGAGGHNGVQSIIDAIGGKNFTRIRIGVAQKGFFGGIKRPKGEALADFVLGTFTRNEEKQLSEVGHTVQRALELLLTRGHQVAMQEIH